MRVEGDGVVYKRCGCRDARGGRQLGVRCPRLGEGDHGRVVLRHPGHHPRRQTGAGAPRRVHQPRAGRARPPAPTRPAGRPCRGAGVDGRPVAGVLAGRSHRPAGPVHAAHLPHPRAPVPHPAARTHPARQTAHRAGAGHVPPAGHPPHPGRAAGRRRHPAAHPGHPAQRPQRSPPARTGRAQRRPPGPPPTRRPAPRRGVDTRPGGAVAGHRAAPGRGGVDPRTSGPLSERGPGRRPVRPVVAGRAARPPPRRDRRAAPVRLQLRHQ